MNDAVHNLYQCDCCEQQFITEIEAFRCCSQTKQVNDHFNKLAVEALEAAAQCIADFIEVYKRDCSKLVFDEAVKSLRDDALAKVRKALNR